MPVSGEPKPDPMNETFPEDGQPAAPHWMVTYSDLITLLLTLFVMIVAMSTIEQDKVNEVFRYFPGHAGFMAAETPYAALESNRAFRSRQQAERYESVLLFLQQNRLQNKVQVNLTEAGMHVVITDSVMFRSGEADLLEPSRMVLRMVADVLGRDVESVTVTGHTDDRPIATQRFPSNWELSAGRAASVVRFLQEQQTGPGPDKYVAIGRGKYHPVEPNVTEEGRARNRRVEILFRWKQWPKKTSKTLNPQNL